MQLISYVCRVLFVSVQLLLCCQWVSAVGSLNRWWIWGQTAQTPFRTQAAPGVDLFLWSDQSAAFPDHFHIGASIEHRVTRSVRCSHCFTLFVGSSPGRIRALRIISFPVVYCMFLLSDFLDLSRFSHRFCVVCQIHTQFKHWYKVSHKGILTIRLSVFWD